MFLFPHGLSEQRLADYPAAGVQRCAKQRSSVQIFAKKGLDKVHRQTATIQPSGKKNILRHSTTFFPTRRNCGKHLNHLLQFAVASPLRDLLPSRARLTSDQKQCEQLEHCVAQTETDRNNLSAQDADLSLARSDDISAKLMLRFVRM